MIEQHDPIRDWPKCSVCAQSLSTAFARITGMELTPTEAGELIERLEAEAALAIAHGAAS